MKKGNDKLTISVDKRVKNLFKELCDKEGLRIGKQIELLMLDELKKRGFGLKKGEDEEKEKECKKEE